MAGNSYNDSSISQLVGAERIRTRPASMLGSSGLKGAQHGFTEMYGNSLDERTAGYGDRLDVIYYEDGSVSIRDYGRGVPLGWNDSPKGKNWNWHLIYNELYAGGKYDNGQWYLQAIGKWREFCKDGGQEEKTFYTPICNNLGIRLDDFEISTEYYRSVGDMDIMRTGETTFKVRVNNENWTTVTWEKLNKRLNYLASVGLNGLGAASTQYTSEFFVVKSYRDGKVTSRSFARGIPLVNGKPFDMFSATLDEIRAIPEEIEDTDEPNGTFIHWKPDDTVFDNVNIGGQWLYEVCRDIADVASIELHFEDKQTGRVETIKAGDMDSLTKNHCIEANIVTDEDGTPYIGKVSNFSNGDIRVEGAPFTYVAKCDITFAVTKNPVKHSCYHNSVHMIEGTQYEAVEAAILRFMEDKAKSRGIKLMAQDFQGKIAVFVSSYSNYASFRNQTKDAVDDMFIYNLIYDTLFEKFQVEYGKGNKVIRDMVETVIKEAELRIATKEWQKIKKDAEKVKREKEPEKFVSCTAYEHKEYDKAELWITEGDSAKGCVKDARNKDFQAIYPIRGKGLNVLKSGLDKILKNKEIREIFALIGTGFDLNIKGEKTFNIDDLRFNKIIFATDADEDGYQIRVLLFATFYKLAPELITKGYVYIAETPRFQITLVDGSDVYALNDVERDKALQKYAGRIKKVQRFKGLGEQDAEILRKTTVHPDSRNLIPLNCDLFNETERGMIDALFGADKYNMRKQILTEILGLSADMLEDEAFILSEETDEETDEEE